MGAVETLIVWENLDINRYTLKNSVTNEIVIKFLNKDQENDQSNFKDAATSAELEVQEKMPLLEWFANEYRNFGCSLEFVTIDPKKVHSSAEDLVALGEFFVTSLTCDPLTSHLMKENIMRIQIKMKDAPATSDKI
ncbi:UNVERIFIED_CONTAM: Eukaryotic peptide chain release factor subunit-3 [Sesamum latifolium]|uniref:Eukaryotic peptide chain release factor subunit-3 n=1 Tax=Sesamum latifolium TaxID=2727402 RepID=A0AAW2TAM3_9LAMI